MVYMNGSLLELRGRPHQVFNGIATPDEVRKSRIHLKMFTGDYMTYEMRSAEDPPSVGVVLPHLLTMILMM